MTVRVLVVDDQPLVRAGLAMLLRAEVGVEVVGEAGDGREAVLLAKDLQPDIVLMDIRMPVVDGVEATRRIASDQFQVDPDRPIRVLILTTYNLDEAVYSALRAGASGFLLKDAAPRDLMSAVHAVAAGDAWLDPAVTRALLAEFAARPDPWVPREGELANLTQREREVLVLVAHGMSNAEIADWLFLGEATVKTHLGRVLMKLDVRDRAQAIVAAYQGGLVVPGSGPPSRKDQR